MPITFHPRPGQILFCDFSNGFKEPEMIKKRPVIVLSGSLKGRSKLATVVPLSTVKPEPVQPYHYLLPRQALPMLGNFQENESWVKGDMVNTVAFHRLDLIQLKTRKANGDRNYFDRKLGLDHMKEIFSCVLHGINMGKLIQHL